MTAFTFNTGIPAANNNPSVDQPDMLINNVSTDAILAVDHVSFNSSGTGGAGASGGQHLQVTFNGKNAPSAQVDPISTLYTGSGTASTNADLFFRNANAIYRPNVIKAFGVFTTINPPGVVTPVTLDTGFNVSSISSNSNGRVFTIALNANAVSGTTVGVFVNMNSDGTIIWSYAANTLTLTIPNSSATAGNIISFQILQV